MKKNLIIILTAIGLCATLLSGCGKPSIEGKWEVCGIELEGEKVIFDDAEDVIQKIAEEEDMDEDEVEEIIEEAEDTYKDAAIGFAEDGVCILYDGDDEVKCEWEEDDDKIIISMEGEEEEIEVEFDGDLISAEEDDLKLYFEKTDDEVKVKDDEEYEKEEATEEPAPEVTEEPFEEPVVEYTEEPVDDPVTVTNVEYVGNWIPYALDYNGEKWTFDGLREELIQQYMDSGMDEKTATETTDSTLSVAFETFEGISFQFKRRWNGKCYSHGRSGKWNMGRNFDGY